jgi:hypothetical protein
MMLMCGWWGGSAELGLEAMNRYILMRDRDRLPVIRFRLLLSRLREALRYQEGAMEVRACRHPEEQSLSPRIAQLSIKVTLEWL